MMKKYIIRHALLMVTISAFIFSGTSQITVTKADNKNIISSNPGFYYALPQTVFKIDIVYEKVQHLEGPFSSYANEYLGTNDYLKEDRTEYNIVNIDVSSFREADPDQYYYVQFSSERLKDAKSNFFRLTETGGISAFNSDPDDVYQEVEYLNDQTYIFNEGEDSFRYMSQYNKRKETDTIIRKINIDTVVIDRFVFNTSWVDKSTDDKARDAAMQISKIRESRFNLITGYHEVDYGSSMIYMDQQLLKMENQYLELFLGKKIKTIEKETIYYIPSPENLNDDILRFKDGRSVILKITYDNITNDIAEESGTILNSIFYRIPANAMVNITSGNINYFSGRFNVNQLGVVTTAPLVNTKLLFDSETGNLLKVVRD